MYLALVAISIIHANVQRWIYTVLCFIANCRPGSSGVLSRSGGNSGSLTGSPSDLVAVVTPLNRIEEDTTYSNVNTSGHQQDHIYVNITDEELERMRKRRRESRKSGLTFNNQGERPDAKFRESFIFNYIHVHKVWAD